MFLSISTDHVPATDLGFLLMKHPERVHEVELAFGRATVFFPQASETRCEAALVLDIDPVGLVRGHGEGDGIEAHYVNDRPYAASSLLSVALNRVFRTAMTGVSRDRPQLAGRPLPLTIHVSPLPARGGEGMLETLFAPLGWSVSAQRIDGPAGPSRYHAVTLTGTHVLADALAHIYVLVPVLDDDKHYWVGSDEVEKLLARGGTWLAAHPARELIALRYLKRRRSLADAVLERLGGDVEDDTADAARPAADSEEQHLEAPARLNDVRTQAVLDALHACGATSVVDLGCGEGRLLRRLQRDRRFVRLLGLDVSTRALEVAASRLKLDTATGPAMERVRLLHGALTYRDERWHDVDAACLVEVIEHLEPDRLPALATVLFGTARPRTVIVTTPNVEHNVLYPSLPAGRLRHRDHRFEWSRAEFHAWAGTVAEAHGYRVAYTDIGEAHPELGPPTQMAVFSR